MDGGPQCSSNCDRCVLTFFFPRVRYTIVPHHAQSEGVGSPCVRTALRWPVGGADARNK